MRRRSPADRWCRATRRRRGPGRRPATATAPGPARSRRAPAGTRGSAARRARRTSAPPTGPRSRWRRRRSRPPVKMIVHLCHRTPRGGGSLPASRAVAWRVPAWCRGPCVPHSSVGRSRLRRVPDRHRPAVGRRPSLSSGSPGGPVGPAPLLQSRPTGIPERPCAHPSVLTCPAPWRPPSTASPLPLARLRRRRRRPWTRRATGVPTVTPRVVPAPACWAGWRWRCGPRTGPACRSDARPGRRPVGPRTGPGRVLFRPASRAGRHPAGGSSCTVPMAPSTWCAARPGDLPDGVK
ncbi:hypothetical protein BG618_02192 [Pseudonocardia autotrophica]|nr:hypothetical protein BG618_02192 [Pseudonocardia autotrophica]